MNVASGWVPFDEIVSGELKGLTAPAFFVCVKPLPVSVSDLEAAVRRSIPPQHEEVWVYRDPVACTGIVLDSFSHVYPDGTWPADMKQFAALLANVTDLFSRARQEFDVCFGFAGRQQWRLRDDQGEWIPIGPARWKGAAIREVVANIGTDGLAKHFENLLRTPDGCLTFVDGSQPRPYEAVAPAMELKQYIAQLAAQSRNRPQAP